jgi:hypothetical protein
MNALLKKCSHHRHTMDGGVKWQNAATADAGRGAGISAIETGFTGSARGNA